MSEKETPKKSGYTNIKSPEILGGLAALAMSVLAYFVCPGWYDAVVTKEIKPTLYSGLMQTYVALLGFIITATSILIVFHDADNKWMAVLKRNKNYTTIFETFVNACWILGISAIIGLVALLFDKGSKSCFLVSIPIVVCLVTVVIAMYRCIWILRMMIKLMLNPNPPPSNLTSQNNHTTNTPSTPSNSTT